MWREFAWNAKYPKSTSRRTRSMSWLLMPRLLTSPGYIQWRHNGRNSVSNHQPHDCLLNRLFRRRSKKTSKLRVTGLCAGNSPVTGEFPAQMASNAENASIWWRHHDQRSSYWQYMVNNVLFFTWTNSCLLSYLKKRKYILYFLN